MRRGGLGGLPGSAACLFSAHSASQRRVERWLCAGCKSLLREEAPLVVQTKAERELRLAAGARQGRCRHVAAFMRGCGAARLPLRCCHHIPAPAGGWTHRERAQGALCSLQVRSNSPGESLLHAFWGPFALISGDQSQGRRSQTEQSTKSV